MLKSPSSEAEVRKAFGRAVRAWRNELDLSQEELAGRAELHRTYVADVERGARNLSLVSMTKLARALRVPISELFRMMEERESRPHDTWAGGSWRHLPRILLIGPDRDEIEQIVIAFSHAQVVNPVDSVYDAAGAANYLFRATRSKHRHPPPVPVLILLDLSVPDPSASHLLRQIGSNARTKSTPTLVVSSSESNPQIAQSCRLGAAGHLVKPIDGHQLRQFARESKLRLALLESVIPS